MARPFKPPVIRGARWWCPGGERKGGGTKYASKSFASAEDRPRDTAAALVARQLRHSDHRGKSLMISEYYIIRVRNRDFSWAGSPSEPEDTTNDRCQGKRTQVSAREQLQRDQGVQI